MLIPVFLFLGHTERNFLFENIFFSAYPGFGFDFLGYVVRPRDVQKLIAINVLSFFPRQSINCNGDFINQLLQLIDP